MKATIIYRPAKASVMFSAPSAEISTGQQIARAFIERPAYDGPVSVVPGEQEQTLQTAGLAVLNNITVQPIPSNYGRIAWNGQTLTVF